ncbi:holo-ACP synthase [Pseudoclavibacter sp. AY1F1]|uniref:holo-ACP synthase n=1 Tax=Pseudoclavibacter sp. AY1F1 TaxID=2080583 RepID=UPI000CE76D4D|nr:holo-ACP synthase [Pseudoclavibacter sp. AY1F1]PPF43841.1 holo-ACP synthase [Pseudoclavibacter sp. AY1F1]
MIVGIGVDTVELARFARALQRAPRLRERLFTPAERERSLASLGARFAAREAAVKALGGIGSLSFLDFEVESGPAGRPEFALSPALRLHLASVGVDHLHLSLTHERTTATAFVIAERAAPAGALA